MTDAYLDSELYVTARDQASLRFDGGQYQDRPRLSEEWANSLVQPLDPKKYGTEIFSATLAGSLLSGYRIALALAQQRGARLRLRLHVADTAPPALHALPWELLYDRDRSVALGGSREIAFSRYLSLPEAPRPPIQEKPRLLIALASPRDLAAGLDPMDREITLKALEKTLKPLAGQMSYQVLEGPTTVARLRERLMEGEFHALHLQAHGLLRSEDSGDSTCLVLEDDAGNAALVEEELLSRIFEGLNTLRLVTLVACHGGKQPRDDPFSGLGPGLVRRGIPAVVAMRKEISFGAAVRFCDHFYRNLSRSGCVDSSVNEARNQLFLSPLEESEFGTPVLFMRLADGLLWEPQAPEPMPIQVEGRNVLKTVAALLKTDSVLPFLGPGLWRGLLPSRSEIAARWIEEYGDDFPLDVLTELPAVAQVLAVGSGAPHDRLVGDLATELIRRQDVVEEETLRGFSLPEVIGKIAGPYFERHPDDPHRILAELPVSTYLTTNPDGLLAAALAWKGKKPRREHCPWRRLPSPQELKRYNLLRGTREEPLVFHLYGKDDEPTSIVLTEDDHLDFLRALAHGQPELPKDLQRRVADSMLLFLGYDPRRLDCRVLLRGLVNPLKEAPRGRIAVLQVDPEAGQRGAELASYMAGCCEKLLIKVYTGTVQSFLTALRDEWGRER